MLVAGVDVGAATAKAAIVCDGELVSSCVMPTGHDVAAVARAVVHNALRQVGLTMDDVDHVCSTGYGRRAVAFSDRAISEIQCHAMGVHHVAPEARTVIDMGGEDTKVIRVRAAGTVADFTMSERFAGGTGTFFESMAEMLGLTVGEMGPMALASKKPAVVNGWYTTVAQSEVVALRAAEVPRGDIVAGLHRAVAHRVYVMARSIDYKGPVAFTGGCAHNPGMVHFLEDAFEESIIVPEPPQIMGALGAALLVESNMGTTEFHGG